MQYLRTRAALGAVVLLMLAVPVTAADWGTIKGKVVWTGKDLPKLDKINVDQDEKDCKANGDLFQQNYVVDPATKGVKYVVVYLYSDPSVKPTIHPDLMASKEKKVVLDQPCCMFEPRVLCLRSDQELEVHNSMKVPHNIKIDGGAKNPNLNQVIPPQGKLDVAGWKASPTAVPISCNVHKWMRGYIRVFDHPYYAVTNAKGEFEIKNAPVGKWRLVVWHEEGYVVGDKKGVEIEVKKDKPTELKFEMKPAK